MAFLMIKEQDTLMAHLLLWKAIGYKIPGWYGIMVRRKPRIRFNGSPCA